MCALLYFIIGIQSFNNIILIKYITYYIQANIIQPIKSVLLHITYRYYTHINKIFIFDILFRTAVVSTLQYTAVY